MWDTFVIQLLSFWLICCVFGFYFSIDVQEEDW